MGPIASGSGHGSPPATPTLRRVRDPNIDPALYTPSKRMRMMTSALAGTASGSFLVSTNPVTSQSSIMGPVLEHVPVLPSPDWGLIQANRPERIEHLSAKELRGRVVQLTESLGRGQQQILVRDSILEASNAQLVIQNIFMRKQSTALHAKENRKSKKGPKAYIDGKGRHFNSTEYIEALETAEQQKIEEEEAKADRARAKEKKKGARAALATEWERIKAAHLVSVQQWEEKCAELTGMGTRKKDLPRKPKRAKKPELPKDNDDDESDGGSDGGSDSE
ncbi:hypothetical protein B0H13DRAFT_1591243 [Mycena leptocephala]|nr:hypothetical protein B0H13DRAFT_1591243 [Mycena leptocephala]